jgi:hypothetical protein
MLSPFVFFAGGMGGWVSSSAWCLRLSTPHISFYSFGTHLSLSSSVAGCAGHEEWGCRWALPPPGTCGRTWPPFLQKLCIVAIKSCLLSFHGLTPSRLWRRAAWVAFGGLRQLGSVSSGQQWVCFSKRTSPRWRCCIGLCLFVLLGENLVYFCVCRRMMAASTSLPSLEASSCMSFMLFSHWHLVVSLLVMCLCSWCALFVQV